jgi:hypothetical protein
MLSTLVYRSTSEVMLPTRRSNTLLLARQVESLAGKVSSIVEC